VWAGGFAAGTCARVRGEFQMRVGCVGTLAVLGTHHFMSLHQAAYRLPSTSHQCRTTHANTAAAE